MAEHGVVLSRVGEVRQAERDVPKVLQLPLDGVGLSALGGTWLTTGMLQDRNINPRDGKTLNAR